MVKDIIQISFVGMEPTEALKKYVLEKILKKEKLFEEATSIEVFLKQNKYSKGIDQDFRVDINVKLPKSPVRVEQRGPDMYANIDLATDTLFRRLKRYYDRKTYWEGKDSWKVLEAEAELQGFEEDLEVEDYSDYVPKISVRKVINDMTPLEEGEAIERMELLGYDQLLFRSKVTGKISMIYRRREGDYGLVEPYEG